MPPSKPPYPHEFKTEAVRLYHQSGKNLQEIASDLGVSTNSLREWVRRTNGENSSKGKSRTSLGQDECEELRRLQRENRILREEREILKKAAASCALWVSLLKRPTGPGKGSLAYQGFMEQEKANHAVA